MVHAKENPSVRPKSGGKRILSAPPTNAALIESIAEDADQDLLNIGSNPKKRRTNTEVKTRTSSKVAGKAPRVQPTELSEESSEESINVKNVYRPRRETGEKQTKVRAALSLVGRSKSELVACIHSDVLRGTSRR